VKVLIAHGADINLRDKSNQTPLDIAMGTHNVISILALRKAQGNSYFICSDYVDLQKWLKDYQIEEFYPHFVKHHIYLEHISAANEKELDRILDKLGTSNSFGTKFRLQKAIHSISSIT
jgi:ankyrin repeat protein